MDDTTHTGVGAGTAVGIGVAALFGVGLLWAASNNRFGNSGCGCGCVQDYLNGQNDGAVKAGIACNTAAISRVESTLSQMQQNGFLAASISAANADNKANQNLNAAVINGQLSAINTTVKSALGNCFVYSKDICPTTTTSTTAS